MLLRKKHEKQLTMGAESGTPGQGNTFGIGLGQAAGAVAGGIFGLIGQRARMRRQHQNQMALMNQQYQNQRQLNLQGHQLQLDMWNKTNYPAQMAMLKEAGLNPALLYGMSGGGGTTAGSQGGGSASGGQAGMLDIGSALSASKLAAEIDLLKSQSDKTKAEERNLDKDLDVKETIIERNFAQAKELLTQANVNEANAKKLLSEIKVNNSVIAELDSRAALNLANSIKALTQEEVLKAEKALFKAQELLAKQQKDESKSREELNKQDLEVLKKYGLSRTSSFAFEMTKTASEEYGVDVDTVITVATMLPTGAGAVKGGAWLLKAIKGLFTRKVGFK